MMYGLLNQGLHSPNGFVRKGSAFLLGAQKQLARRVSSVDEFAMRPPVLANSFPKSGTHLLDQIAAALPDRLNYGAFLSSYTSSFQYRLRTTQSTLRFIRRSLPGELVRAHLHFEPEFDEALEELRFVHYFIYRDPRDVVVSMSHWLRYMNRWHRLSKRVRELPTDEESIRLLIAGLDGGGPESYLPNVAERFKRYDGWLSSPHAFSVRFEDLVGPDRDRILAEIVQFYAARSRQPVEVAETVSQVAAAIAPEKSHTFRSGKRGGWRDAFTPELTSEFKRVAGDLLIQLGYEQSSDW